MANFNNIKHEIDQNVNTNGVQAITGAILNETLKDMIDEVDDKKQDTLVAGSGIAINGNVISATGGSGQSYTAAPPLAINNDTIYLNYGTGIKTGEGGALEADFDYVQEKLTAGTNIQISGSTISATDTTYSAGQGLDLNGTTFSVDYDEVQEKLESGQNIKTVNGYSLLGSGDIVIGGGGGGNYLPLEGGTLQNTAPGEDTELKVIDGMDEDYVKIVAPESQGEKPHVEIFENGSGDTKIYYDHIERGSQVSIDLPSSSGTLALTTDIPEAGSGLIENQNGEFEVDTTAIQEKLVAGQNITIQGNVISASGGSGQSYVAGNGIDITGNTISVDNTVATTSDLAGYLPLTGGNLQASSIATEVRVKSPSDDSYVYLHAVDTGSPTIKFHRDIQNPTNGEVHEITLHDERLDIERWDQSGNTWEADTLYFPQFKTGTIALDTDLAGKQDTLTAGTGITIQNNVISATGGSGSGLWTSGTGTDSLVGPDGGTATGAGSISLNGSSTASNSTAMSGGYRSSATGWNSFSYGNHATASRDNSISLGNYTNATVADGVALGEYTNTGNVEPGSIALGRYNYVNASSLGNTSNTVFSIGNGQTNSNRSNALELTAGNSFYMTGVGGFTGSNSANSTSVQDVINGKQDTLTAGTGISIQNNVISATGGGGTTYTASSGIDISQNNEIAVSAGNGLTFNPNTDALQVDWSSLPTGNGLVYATDPVDPNISNLQVDTNTIQEKLVAGSNITINGNVISASGGSGSGLWVNGTGTNSLLSPAAQANNSDATGTASVAGGKGSVLGNYSVAFGEAVIGNQSYPNSSHSFAAGNAKVYGSGTVGIGGVEIWGDGSVALGNSSTVMNADHAVALNAEGISSDYGFSAAGGYAGAGNPHTVAPFYQVSIGHYTKTYNESEVALGCKNKSSHGNTDATKTFFSIGDSRSNVESNVFEIMRNDDLYVKSVGGYDGTNASAAGIKTLQTVLNGKQDQLTAGTGISIQNNVISATGGSGASYTAGAGITIDQNNEISANPDGVNVILDSNDQLSLDFTGVAGNLQGTGLQVDSNTGTTLEVDFSQIPGNIAGNGLQDSGNGTLEIDTTTIASDLSSSFLPLTGGVLQEDPNDNIQTNLDVYSPDQLAIGYIYSYSEDTSDPQNPIPAFVELGLQGQSSGSADTTQGIYLRSNGTIAVDYIVDSQGNTDMVELELPRKASGQTYTIATLDDIQGGGSYVAGNGINISGSTISVDTGYLDGEYLPLTGGQLKANPSDAETLLDVAAPDSTSAISMSADTIDSKLAISADKTNAGISDGDTFRTVLSNTGEIQVSAKTVNPQDPTDIGETTYTLVLPQKNDTIATLSDIQGGGSSYTAGTGISISAQNVISNSAPDPGIWVAGSGTNSFRSSSASPMSNQAANSIAIGYNAIAGRFSNGGVGSVAIGYGASAGQGFDGDYAVAIGSSLAGADYSYAMGNGLQVFGENAVALGSYNVAYSSSAGTSEQIKFAIGNGTGTSSRSDAFEIKQNGDAYLVGVGGFDGTNAGQSGVETLQQAIANAGGGGSSLWTSGSGNDSLLGPGSIGADGDYSIAAGEDSNAQANRSVALGGGVVVYDDSDPNNIINGEYGVAIGTGATVETASSLAMMGGTASSQNGGSHSVAIGDGATAEGMYDVALTGSSSGGNYSFAASTGIAVGHYSTGLSGGEGDGEGSLASGFGSVAYGYSSAALGLELMTYDQADGTLNSDPNAGEAAFGRYNYSEQNIIFSIGCGHYEPPVDPTDPADVGTKVRENAITITNDGKIYLKGLGGYTGTSVSGCTDLVSFLNNL